MLSINNNIDNRDAQGAVSRARSGAAGTSSAPVGSGDRSAGHPQTARRRQFRLPPASARLAEAAAGAVASIGLRTCRSGKSGPCFSTMESDPAHQDRDPRLTAMAVADQARRRLTSGLRLPAGLYLVLATAVAVQLGAAAYGIAAQTVAGLAVVLAGPAVFLGLAALMLHRFRRIHGVRVDGLTSQIVFAAGPPPHSSTLASSPPGYGPPSTRRGGSSQWRLWQEESAVHSAPATGGTPTGTILPPTRVAPPRGSSARSPCSRAWGSRRSWSSADGRTRSADPSPTRLQLVTMLSAVSEAEFATLRTVLEVSDSVLSKHVSALVRCRLPAQSQRLPRGAADDVARTDQGGPAGPARPCRGTAPDDRRARLTVD